MAPPEKRLRNQIRHVIDPAGSRRLQGLGQVIGEGVPGDVRAERADPLGSDEDRCGGDPEWFEESRGVAAREAERPEEKPGEPGNPAQTGHEKGDRQACDAGGPKEPDFAQEEREDPHRRHPGGEDAREVPVSGFSSPKEPRDRVSREERQSQDRQRDQHGHEVARGNDEHQSGRAEERQRGARPLPDREDEESKAGGARETGDRDHGQPMLGQQFRNIVGDERNRPDEDQSDEENQETGEESAPARRLLDGGHPDIES